MRRPFAGIRVLDVTHVLAGPFCAWQFALLGADVIKIENPADPDCARGRGPDDADNADLRGLNYQVQGTNKRALALDLKAPAGADVLKRLAATADVLVENYRRGAMDALGLGYPVLGEINPALVYCSLTGFGAEGPRAGDAAYDNTIQAASGVVTQSGGQKPGLSFIDYATGYAAAFAVSAALFRRARDGRGAHIACSMYETALMLMGPEAAWARSCSDPPRPKEAGLASYDTAQGVLMLGAFTPKQNARLWALLEREGYDAERFGAAAGWRDLWQSAGDMRAALGPILLTRTAREWQALFHAGGVPAERVRTLAEAVADEQLEATGFFQAQPGAARELPVGGYRISEGGPAIRSPAPAVGQHSDEVLLELGLAEDEIAALRRDGVVA